MGRYQTLKGPLQPKKNKKTNLTGPFKQTSAQKAPLSLWAASVKVIEQICHPSLELPSRMRVSAWVQMPAFGVYRFGLCWGRLHWAVKRKQIQESRWRWWTGSGPPRSQVLWRRGRRMLDSSSLTMPYTWKWCIRHTVRPSLVIFTFVNLAVQCI